MEVYDGGGKWEVGVEGDATNRRALSLFAPLVLIERVVKHLGL